MYGLHQHAIYSVNTSLGFLTNDIEKLNSTMIYYTFLTTHVMLNGGGKA